MRRHLVILLLLWGCESAPEPAVETPRLVATDVVITVTNETPHEVQVYVGSDSLQHFLGAISRRASRSFSLPSDLGRSIGPLHFDAEIGRGGSPVSSDTFRIAAGQQVIWVLDLKGRGTIKTR